MLVRRGSDPDFVKVLDFGMARMPAGSGPVLTKAGLIFGTARYISPEGAAGQPVAPPGDVYAIATVLYQTLAGRTPFEGETAVEVLARQINEPPPPLRSQTRSSYVPEPIAEVIDQNLAKEPEQRSPDARALARALLEAARAAGLAPEALVARSALLGEAAHEPAFVSAAPTRQLEFGAGLSARVARSDARAETAHESSAEPSSNTDRTARQARRLGTRGTLTFLLGCVAGGVALAAVGARLRTDGGASSAAGDKVAPGPRPATGGGADAGAARYADSGSSRTPAP
jgi:serine/threonine-protein kinase